MEAVAVDPAAGAHGELTGSLMIRAGLAERRDPGKFVLIPDSAHGTNPASVTISGYTVKNIKSNERGCVDLSELERTMNEEVAGLMLTNPNTLCIFETQIREISDLNHTKSGLLYMTGAHINALVGIARPKE